MNRRIFTLALPNVISNISVPLLGMVDIAIAGRLANGSTAIAAIGIGATIFNFIYWNFAFLRMGTSGMTAQALGARDFKECSSILLRALTVAIGLAITLIILQKPLSKLSLALMFASDSVEELALQYFLARIWAAPATISLYALHGWFIGMSNSKTPMWTSILINIVNIIAGITFVYKFNMGISGIAWSTVMAQYSGMLFSLIIWFTRYKILIKYIDIKEAFVTSKLVRFFSVNKDIFLRTGCIIIAYTFFTSASSAMGDEALAINSLLMQFFTLFSYLSDGMSYAAESLVGKYIGARNKPALKECVQKLMWWSAAFAVPFIAAYALAWRPILSLFSKSSEIINGAQQYIPWVVLIPVVCTAPFMIDGMLIGATKTRTMRNTMYVSLAIFFASYYGSRGIIGTHSVWFAFIMFMAARWGTMVIATKNLKTIYDI